jgi:CubicO group peptidase (beta-lactamase class C family)
MLASQAPEKDPRAMSAYHALTFGWLCGELIRRIDGRTAGRFFAEEVASPLDLDLWIGLPDHLEPRVSTIVQGASWSASPICDEDTLRSDELMASTWANPPFLAFGKIPWNRSSFHAAEIAGANGIGTARSIARLFCCLAQGGEFGGVRLLRPETIEAGRRELNRISEAFLREPLAFGVGFQLQTELGVYGPPASAFGHSGAGGSIHVAWPDQGVGVSYAMNELRYEPEGDKRSQALLRALYESLS